MCAKYQIIGGGLLGLATAYALSERGAVDIRIIEARDGLALGTSYANAGMVHASLADPWNSPGVGAKILKSLVAPSPAMALKPSALPHLGKWGMAFLNHARPAAHWHATCQNYGLAVHSLSLIDKWRAALQIDDDGDKKGLLKIYRSTKDFEKAAAFSSSLSRLGLRYDVLAMPDLTALEPALAPIQGALVGAIYYPDDFKADAYKFCAALGAELRRRGTEVITGTRVDALVQNGDTIVGASGLGQVFRAKTTIVAAGAHSAALMRSAGLSLPVRPVKGYSLTFDNISGKNISGKNISRPALPVVDDTLHAAITPLGDRLRIAGTAQIAGFNASLKDKDLAPLLTMLNQVYPEVAAGLSLRQAAPWYGYRPVSADGMPYIGRAAVSGLALNTGHGHMGWTFSAGSGDVLADILHGKETAIDTAAFAANR